MNKYLLSHHVLHHINKPKTSGNKIGILFLFLKRRENYEKLKLSPTNKTRVNFLLVTFDVLRLYIVTEKKSINGVC